MKFLLLFLCVYVFSCVDSPKVRKKNQVRKYAALTITNGERDLLRCFQCDTTFDIDSISTVSEYKIFRNEVLKEKRSCISFKNNKEEYRINLSPNYVSLGGTVRNIKKRLLISIKDTQSILMYSGGFVSSFEVDLKNLDSVVFRFLQSAYDIESKENKKSIAYWKVGITLDFPTDNISFSSIFLSGIIKGYIYYQESKSLELFSKPIDSLSRDQKKLLVEKSPLFISMGENVFGHKN